MNSNVNNVYMFIYICFLKLYYEYLLLLLNELLTLYNDTQY
jgi:hypothetical protein